MKTGDAVREDRLRDLSRERRTILPEYRGECNMKITFFKNESQFYPRRSYLWTNAEKVDVDFKFKRLRKHSQLLFVIPLVIFLTFLRFGSDWLFCVIIAILCTPVHELCHALFCWLSGRKVEGIYFFPYKRVFSSVTAYVKPAFGVWNKTQAVLFSLFPIILLSFVPAIAALFISSLRIWLLFLSVFNLSTSCFDIIDVCCLLKLPRNCLHFGDFILTVVEADHPVIIHQLFVTSKLDKIDHKCFQFYDNKLTGIDSPPESCAVNRLREEFVKQFNFKQT